MLFSFFFFFKSPEKVSSWIVFGIEKKSVRPIRSYFIETPFCVNGYRVTLFLKEKEKKKKGQKISEKNRTFNECFQRFLLLVTIWPWFDSIRAFLREESNARPSGIYAILIVHGVHLVSIVSAVTSAACISFRRQWLNWPSRLKFPLRWVIYPVARYSLSRCS